MKSNFVYIITQHLAESSGMGPQFFTEVYTDKEKADKRLAELRKGLRAYCGYWYEMDYAQLDTTRND